MNLTPTPSAATEGNELSHKGTELAKDLLSALFMAIRTADTHDAISPSFEAVVESVRHASEALVRATGGFTLRFEEAEIWLNGSKLRLDGGTEGAAPALFKHLEPRGLTQLDMRSLPSAGGIRRLVELFTRNATDEQNLHDALPPASDKHNFRTAPANALETQLNTKVLALRSYGELLLALRAQNEYVTRLRDCDWGEMLSPPRMGPRIQQVLQDIIELAADRADFLVRICTSDRGASPAELHGANTCVLSIMMGYALNIERQDLRDIATAALFHNLGAPLRADGNFQWAPKHASASLARFTASDHAGPQGNLRAMVIGEQPLHWGSKGAIAPHPYARLVKVAAAYNRLTTGFGSGGHPVHPLSALARLFNADTDGIDRHFVDLLINVLRAFPVGCRVSLDDGRSATVISQLGGARWDRPMVRTEGDSPQNLDLSLRQNRRFLARIQATDRFLGKNIDHEEPLDESAIPLTQTTTDLEALLQRENDWERESSSRPVPSLGLEDLVLTDVDIPEVTSPSDTEGQPEGLRSPLPKFPDFSSSQPPPASHAPQANRTPNSVSPESKDPTPRRREGFEPD